MSIVWITGIASISMARPGDIDQPMVLAQFPFGQTSTTVGRPTNIRTYGCDQSLDESGPEVIYQLNVSVAGLLTASVEGDGNGVDIDIHLLASLDLDGSGHAADCLDRGNQSAEANVTAGTYYAVVDSYNGSAQAGPFRLHLDLKPADAWYERQVAQGVGVRTRVFADLAGGKQTVSVLTIDPHVPNVVIKPICDRSLHTTSTFARMFKATAAINGGYFDSATVASSSLVKIDGEIFGYNKSCSRYSFGIDSQGGASLARIDAGADWPEAVQAMGGVLGLVNNGQENVNGGEDEHHGDCPGDSLMQKHPRTGLALDAAGGILMVTVDGRTSAGVGMTPWEFADLLISLGAKEAMNFDGGGSTTLYINGPFYEGVLNYPSGGGGTSHGGERAVFAPLAIWAEPLVLDPVWISVPPDGSITHGQTWSYEAVASHPQALPLVITVSGQSAGSLQLLDRQDSTARIDFTPAAPDGADEPVQILLVATTSTGQSTTQTLLLCLDGKDCQTPQEEPGGEEDEKLDAAAGQDGGMSDGDSVSTTTGCSCQSKGFSVACPFSLFVLVVLFLLRRCVKY